MPALQGPVRWPQTRLSGDLLMEKPVLALNHAGHGAQFDALTVWPAAHSLRGWENFHDRKIDGGTYR